MRRTRPLLAYPLAILLATALQDPSPRHHAAAREEDGALSAATKRYNRGRELEITAGDPAAALEAYLEVLALLTMEDAGLRGEAKLGAARCYVLLDRGPEAERLWQEILDDPDLPTNVHANARVDRGNYEKELSEEERGRRETEVFEESLRRSKAARAEYVQELVDEARRAHADGRIALASRRVAEALHGDPSHAEALALRARIDAALPEQGEVLRNILQFMDTARLEFFQRLREEISQVERRGKAHHAREEYAEADAVFREGIARIDASPFLGELAQERALLLTWLTSTIDNARSRQGLELPPPPGAPRAEQPSIQRRFFDLLEDLHTAAGDADEPVQIYDMRARPSPGRAPERSLVTGPFEDAIQVGRQPGAFQRAAWAEAWLRGEVVGGWKAPHLLERYGDVLVVQHRPNVHRVVRELLDGFAAGSRGLAVDVALLATTTAGGTRIASTTRARSSPRDAGLDPIVRDVLFEDVLGQVRSLDGVRHLGTARVALSGESGAVLDFTQPIERHPLLQDERPPPLETDEGEARFGLWLELYAEDRGGRRNPAAALGVRARTRLPQGSVVVPATTGAQEWSRRPKPMAGQEVASHRVLPHAGTLLLYGLANPFPTSAVSHPDLVLLLAVRPASEGAEAAVPDVPRREPGAAGPPSAGEREYDLGPLAGEVGDAVLLEGWPQRPATEPVAPLAQRRAREDWLAGWLASAAGLGEPGRPGPVTVRGEVATARLAPEDHDGMHRAVQALRAQEHLLYEVDVLGVETGEARLAEWLRLSEAQGYTPGTFVVGDAAAAAGLEEAMRREESLASPYAVGARLLARATQRVMAKALRAQAIVADLRFARSADGTQRVVPVPGVAEEGIVVLVRAEGEAGGRRMVTVDARAARLRGIEPVRLPGIEREGATVQVPRHLPVQSRQAGVPLRDGEAFLLTLPAPEANGRTIVIRIAVRRLP